jgi:hypothetical protein
VDNDPRVVMAVEAENDYYREDINSIAASLRRLATIMARAKMATDPPVDFYKRQSLKYFSRSLDKSLPVCYHGLS